MSDQKAIPLSYIMSYVDTLLRLTNQLDKDSAMQKATALRAEAILDLVGSWKQLEGKR